jgi:hypothetical protein
MISSKRRSHLRLHCLNDACADSSLICDVPARNLHWQRDSDFFSSQYFSISSLLRSYYQSIEIARCSTDSALALLPPTGEMKATKNKVSSCMFHAETRTAPSPEVWWTLILSRMKCSLNKALPADLVHFALINDMDAKTVARKLQHHFGDSFNAAAFDYRTVQRSWLEPTAKRSKRNDGTPSKPTLLTQDETSPASKSDEGVAKGRNPGDGEGIREPNNPIK